LDFDEANTIGESGEREVARTLDGLAGSCDFVAHHGLLIETRKRTAQIDHVVVDSHGIVLVETKVRRGALLKGRDTDSHWTACYPGGRTETFLNPLRQNVEHESKLREVLAKDAAGAVHADYFSSVAVFVGAGISQLELSSRESLKVRDVGELARFFAERSSFAIHGGDWSPAEVAAMVRRIRAADRSSDPAVVALHQKSRSRARGRRARRPFRDAPAMPTATARASAPRMNQTSFGPTLAGPPWYLELIRRLGGAAAVVIEVSAVFLLMGIVWYWVFFAGGAGLLYSRVSWLGSAVHGCERDGSGGPQCHRRPGRTGLQGRGA
jgi:hypothetical protein